MISSFDNDIINCLIDMDSEIKLGKLSETFEENEILYFKSKGINNFIFNKNVIDQIISSNILLNCNLFIYTLFDDVDNQKDIIILNKINKTNINVITDDYKKTLSLI